MRHKKTLALLWSTLFKGSSMHSMLDCNFPTSNRWTILQLNRTVRVFSNSTANECKMCVKDKCTLLFFVALNLSSLFIWSVLLCFEVVSGLKINLSKTQMVPLGEDPDIDALAAILGCKVSALPMKYLRQPLGARFKSKAIWDSNLEKMEKRLARWNKLYLSMGGRITLITSTLSSLPMYFLSLFAMQASTANCFEKQQRHFLWEGLGNEVKHHLVNWKTVSQFQAGGLGVHSLVQFNIALLGKWLWRFALARESLWSRVIAIIYGCDKGDWVSGMPIGPQSVFMEIYTKWVGVILSFHSDSGWEWLSHPVLVWCLVWRG